ncbi:MAG: twin-arginine translocase subunit TatC [Candidatus Caenarcaniphilales bacterium]|nr:twin-arginine translocase subunit TatC [Candidatus Caenarcaniphilales bacterium]
MNSLLEKISKKENGLEQHLEELRHRIIFCLLWLVITVAISFFLTPYVIKIFELLAPKGTSFFQIKPGELFFVYLRISFLLGTLASVPFFLYQFRSFIWPGLKDNEKKIGNLIIFGSPILFLLGAGFAYFIALKPMLAFLLGFGVDLALVQPQYSLEYYISLIIAVICILGLAFQIPVLIFVMAIMDLVTSKFLLKFWRQSLFGSFVLAAILTPTPDPINMGIVGFAIVALYAFSVLLVKIIGK